MVCSRTLEHTCWVLEFLRLFKRFLGNIISGVDGMYDDKFMW